MATLDQLKELFKNQEEREDMRREKDKEDEERKRREDKEEVKDVIKSHMSPIKDDIKEIKMKQDNIEGQVIQSENRMEKKFDDMGEKFESLEKKVKELEDREREKESKKIDSSKIWPPLHPEGRTKAFSQLALQPEGRMLSSSRVEECSPSTNRLLQLNTTRRYTVWSGRPGRLWDSAQLPVLT